MQSDEMIARGLANKRGNVIVIWDEPTGINRSCKVCRVQFDGHAENLPAHSLVRERKPC
jgi:hypothetical protein